MRMIGQRMGMPARLAMRTSVIFRSDGREWVLTCSSGRVDNGVSCSVAMAVGWAALYRTERRNWPRQQTASLRGFGALR